MITVNEWCTGWMGGVGKWLDECSANGGVGERLVPKFSVLKTLTEGAAMTFTSREITGLLSIAVYV